MEADGSVGEEVLEALMEVEVAVEESEQLVESHLRRPYSRPYSAPEHEISGHPCVEPPKRYQCHSHLHTLFPLHLPQLSS